MKFLEGVLGAGGMEKVAVDLMTGELTRENRQRMAGALKLWLANNARKKPLANLPALVAEFGKRIDSMCGDMDIQIVDRKPVVTVVGTGRDTLRALERGTNWFDPCDGVVSVMISALWKS